MAAGARPMNKLSPYIKFSWVLLVGGVAACLISCSGEPDHLWADYRARLSRVLQVELPANSNNFNRALSTTPSPSSERLTESRETTQTEPDTRLQAASVPALSMLEVHQSRPCGLDQLAATRNNQLGKVMSASVQLHYELQLLATLPTCIRHPSIEPALQQKLNEIYQHKQQLLSLHWQQFLQHDATLRQQLSGSLRGLPRQPGSSTPTQQALRQLLQLQSLINQQNYAKAAMVDIEAALSQLYQGQLLADLQYSLRRSEAELRQLNQQLAVLTAEQLCSVDSTVRDNVLQQIFIGRVQQHLAQLVDLSTELTPLLLQLYQQQPFAAEVITRFSTPTAQLKTQLKAHVRFWQAWQQCANS